MTAEANFVCFFKCVFHSLPLADGPLRLETLQSPCFSREMTVIRKYEVKARTLRSKTVENTNILLQIEAIVAVGLGTVRCPSLSSSMHEEQRRYLNAARSL